jgi:hypothetical protein
MASETIMSTLFYWFLLRVRGLIKNIPDTIYFKKTKSSTSYSKLSTSTTTLQIVCSDSSDPSTFQCMSGRLVWELPATAVSYLVVSPRRLEIVSPSGCSSAWGRGRSRRGPKLVSNAGGEPRGCCAWPRIP